MPQEKSAPCNDRLLTLFDSLEQDEQTAWLAYFAAQSSHVVKYGEKWDTFGLFGKAECGWVDFEKVWLGKFVDLGWLEIVETDRFKALGITGQPESVKYEFKATELGWSVREAYWERLAPKNTN